MNLKKFGISMLASATLLTTTAPLITNKSLAATTTTLKKNIPVTAKAKKSLTQPLPTSPSSFSTKDKQVIKAVQKNATVTHKNGVTTVAISDKKLIPILNKAYSLKYDPYDQILARRYSRGKTYVKFYGRKRSGNVDIYLSARMLNKIRQSTINAGISVIYGLFAIPAGVSSMGVAWLVFMKLVKKIATLVVDQTFNSYKAGRVYKLRHWKYAGWRYQR